MLTFLRSLFLALMFAGPAAAQGTLPIELQQQFKTTACVTTSGVCGQPLVGGLLYFYQVGTVATQQNSFQDTGLTIPNPWPLPLDASGRVPPFYLANGSVHVRLTDSGGVVQFDVANMLVIGPSSGGGGGGSIDPTTIASTGDFKWRPSGEVLAGWVKLNGLTIGSATSGATGRANSDTQALYIYLWNTFSFITVSGGRGASGLADFNANKTLQLFDMRGTMTAGLDDMGAAASGRLAGLPMAYGNVTTPGSEGGETTHTLAAGELPAHTHSGTTGTESATHTHTISNSFLTSTASGGSLGGGGSNAQAVGTTSAESATHTHTLTAATCDNCGGTSGNRVPLSVLGTFYMKL